MSDELALKPLAFDDVVRVLDALGRAELVLVGGQAVAIWAYHYASAGRVPELTDEREMFVSKDVDALTSAEELRGRMVELAHHLDGESQVDAISPRGGQELGPPLPNSTVVRFVDSGGIPREVDVLDRLFGVFSRTTGRAGCGVSSAPATLGRHAILVCRLKIAGDLGTDGVFAVDLCGALVAPGDCCEVRIAGTLLLRRTLGQLPISAHDTRLAAPG